MNITTINPATAEVLADYPILSFNEIDQIIAKTHQAFLEWCKTSFQQRQQKLLAVAEKLKAQKQALAKSMALEMGKPILQGMKEIEKCAWVCEHFAKHAEGYLQPEIIQTEMAKSYVSFQPLGVVFAIMPWNFPCWQVFRFLAPTLMLGNGALLKHASNCVGTALAIQKIIQSCGFPENIFRVLVIENEQAEHVIEHHHVVAVTLTGSERAGKMVGSQAAKNLKKIVLELGGSDPYVILADADLEKAADICIESRLSNAGQVCIAAKRLILVPEIAEEFKALIITKAKQYQCGDPLDEKTKLGPMARADLRDTVHKQVQDSINKGAELICGGIIPGTPGFYYPTTILDNVKLGMAAFDQEIFGPVIAFISAKDQLHAIELANQTCYGLGAAVFTQDLNKGEEIARDQLQAGACFVNAMVGSDPRLPFGGIKGSGYGRELAAEGIKEFANIKTVCVAK